MYLEQRVEKLEALVIALQAELTTLRACEYIGYPEDQPQAEQPQAETPAQAETPVQAEAPKAETTEQAEQVYTLDDVRAKVTEVMKADKSKKGALQALLKKHGADRVSELDESKFAAVIDAIEKGVF